MSSLTRGRLTTGVVAGALSLTMAAVPLSQASAADPTTTGLSLWYPLQNDTGTVIKDASGNGKDGVLVGGGATEGAAGLKFDGANYVTMPNNLITDLTAVSVTAEVLIDPSLNAGSNYFFYNLGNKVDPNNSATYNGYLFASDSANLYKARISDNNWDHEQSAARAGALPRSEWHNVAFTFDGPTMVLYLDGVEVARNSAMTIAPKDIGVAATGETNYNALARSAYINDAMFKGRMRDFRLYTRALAGTEVADISAFNAGPSLTSNVEALTLGNTSKVEANLTLPAKAPYGSTVTWKSANPALVSDAGVITKPADAPATTTLTATLTGRDGATQTKDFSVTVMPTLTPAQRAQRAVDAVEIINADDARGNLTIPTVSGAENSTITWTSSNPAVVSATGVVTRQATAQTVTLTATTTVDGATATRDITITVPAAVGALDLEGYLFSYFIGEGYSNGEQIYFGLSKGNDPLNYQNLNNNQPVLTSTLGTQGLRDPFIIRSPEGDKFYQIATDLKIYGNGAWDASQRTGSKSIMVWESTDLVNWTDQRLVKVSPDTAGNTWAPEAYYDDELGAYVVFWASKLYAETDVNHTGTAYNHMMYATTRDFVTFTPAQVWKDTGYSVIDSTVIKESGTYYRFSKDERSNTTTSPCGKFIFGEKSTSLTSTDFTPITECIGKGQVGAGEGPTIFKDNEAEKWYMFIDEFGGRGYVPFQSTNLDGDASAWTIPASYSMPSRPRHGTVLPVTQAEYDRLLMTYQPNAAVTDIAPFTQTVQVDQAPVLPSTVVVTHADGSTATETVVWDAVDPAKYAQVGTFTVNGTVKAAPGKTAVATITVQAEPVPATSVTASSDSLIMKVGATRQLTASVDPVTASDPTLTWASSDTTIARVDAAGTVTGRAAGTATVTVSAKGADGAVVTDTVEVKVVTDVADGLIVHYGFDETGAVATDLSGNGLNGAITGAAARVEGVDGKGLALTTGTNPTYVTIPEGALGTDSITVSAWQKWAPNGSQDPWLWSLGTDRNKYFFEAPSHWSGGTSSGITINTYSGEQRATRTGDLASATWVNVTTTLGDGQLVYYVNGVEVARKATTIKPTDINSLTDNISGYIGKSMYAEDPTYQGTVDDFRIFNRALTAAEVAALMDPSGVVVGPDPSPTPTVEPSPSVSPSVEPSVSQTATVEPTASASVEPSVSQTATVGPTASASTSVKPSVTPTVVPSTPAVPDVYSTPGFHVVNGRHWYTTCEAYSQTQRCRTEIWASQWVMVDGKPVLRTGWVFNNLTYLPMMTKAQWGTNPLANTGMWTSSGAQWRTECNTAVTGANACRSYMWRTYLASQKQADGSTKVVPVTGWVLNNIVRFKVA